MARVGRPFGKSHKFNQFLVTFRGEEETQLLCLAKEKATEWDIPLKAIFISALKKWVNGTISYEEIESGSSVFIIQ